MYYWAYDEACLGGKRTVLWAELFLKHSVGLSVEMNRLFKKMHTYKRACDSLGSLLVQNRGQSSTSM